MTENQLLTALYRVLPKYYNKEKVVATKDYIYVIGDIPIALIAHLDTVHSTPPTSYFHDTEKEVIWTPEGLGADDRAGVFSILMLIKAGYRPSIIFLTQEETGGCGAEALIKDYPKPLTSLNFLIELDRRGTNDAVYYNCGNVDFENFISSFGLVTEQGSFSDIYVIAPAWDTAAVNLSIGYFDEHTRHERLEYRNMFEIIERVKKILENCGEKHYDFQPVTHESFQLRVIDGLAECDCCNKWFTQDSMTFALEEEDFTVFRMCPMCTNKHVSFCKECGKAFINIDHHETRDKCLGCIRSNCNE